MSRLPKETTKVTYQLITAMHAVCSVPDCTDVTAQVELISFQSGAASQLAWLEQCLVSQNGFTVNFQVFCVLLEFLEKEMALNAEK